MAHLSDSVAMSLHGVTTNLAAISRCIGQQRTKSSSEGSHLTPKQPWYARKVIVPILIDLMLCARTPNFSLLPIPMVLVLGT